MTDTVTYASQMTPEQRSRVTALKVQVERPHDRIVYGQARRVEPTFCDAIIGDGSHLLVVTSVQTVPAYHAILVDSSWVKAASNPFNATGLEADLDEDSRRDLLVEVLKDTCGDADAWHEEHGDDEYAPTRYFHSDMGFYWGLECLREDGTLASEPLPA